MQAYTLKVYLSHQQSYKTFAETTASLEFPKKDIEYVIAISKITPSANSILYTSTSWISNDRFCVYFKNKNIVDNLIENHSQIQVNGIPTII